MKEHHDLKLKASTSPWAELDASYLQEDIEQVQKLLRDMGFNANVDSLIDYITSFGNMSSSEVDAEWDLLAALGIRRGHYRTVAPSLSSGIFGETK